jgi:forespore regulator of the sigma-K checkpoint
MKVFSLWKQIKKRLRRRRPMWTLGSLLFLLALGFSLIWTGSIFTGAQTVFAALDAPAPSLIETLRHRGGILTVKLHRVYLCGEEIKPLGRMDARQTVVLLQSHPNWTARLDGNGTVWMEEAVDELSAFCKEGAYFSIDKQGFLSLFDGPPDKEKVLRTFFQLDVGYLESSLPKERLDELERGIRVTDLAEFNSVLSTFSDYALQKSERVMKPAY